MDFLKSLFSGGASPRTSSSSNNNSNNNDEEEPTTRLSKYATCVRQIAATAPYKKKFMFNDPGFDADLLAKQGSLLSSKFAKLLDTIRELDAEDMRKHGTLYKHFIFTDLRKASFGAKAIGSFLAANGFELIFKAEKGFRRRKITAGEGKEKKPVLDEMGKPTYRMDPTKKLKVTLAALAPTEKGSNRVGLLQSSPLWKSQLGVDVRKKMLGVFNGRPDNIHGELIRIMVLDSKFKEGIDLYDVKYVHLMEPQITEADLKQAVGRATRFCGQRGLTFIPNVGWPLEVYMYESQFGNAYPFRVSGEKKLFDAHNYMLAHSGLDLGLLEMTRNLTVLAIKSAVDYDLTYKINNFKVQSEILSLTDLHDAIVVEVSPTTGGAVKVIPSAKDIDPTKCMPRANKLFPFTVPTLKAALAARGIKVPAKVTRDWYCKQITPVVLNDLLRGRKTRNDEAMVVAKATVKALTTPEMEIEAKTANTVEAQPDVDPAYQQLFPLPAKPERLTKKEIEELPDLAEFFGAHEAAVEFDAAAKKMGFAEFQAFVTQRYAKFGWDAPVVKNGCESAPVPGKAVQFSKSQDFVRHYLTPASPFRGLLAWHSVGTGKTCTAVATATTEFEKQGYSILWVTRNSLMADVWKNMFGAVCSITVQEKLDAGKKMPKTLGGQKRLVGKQWFDPISYRTLQNALVPVKKGKRKGAINKLGRALRERNGVRDPLAKTFVIIDEVHKLLDGDLKKSEMADFEEVAKAIQHSYRVSGANSVRVLLMTATPITDNPEGLFKLLNLLIPKESEKFPSMEDFRAEFTTEDGQITAEGAAFFQDRARGLISYLNREFDPSTFAQPHFHSVKVPVSGSLLESDEALIESCLEAEATEDQIEEIDCDIAALEQELEDALEDLEEYDFPKKELAERKKTLKTTYKGRIQTCKNKLKERIRQVKERAKLTKRRMGLCITDKAKTRRKGFTMSQQKAMKRCLGKDGAFGEPPAFTKVSDLKKMAQSKHAATARSTRATRGKRTVYSAASKRSKTDDKNRYTRKVKKHHTKSSKNSTSSINSE